MKFSPGLSNEFPPKSPVYEEFSRRFAEIASAMKSDDKEKLRKLKREMRNAHPEDIEEVSALFGFFDLARDQAKISSLLEEKNKDKKDADWWKKESKQTFESLTSFQYLLNHFACTNSGDANFMRDFWSMGKKLCFEAGGKEIFEGVKRGVLTQVAIFKSLEALGHKPALATPAEDAYEAIDFKLQGEEDAIFQTKGSSLADEILLAKTEMIDFPGVEADSPNTPGGKVMFRKKMSRDFTSFRQKVSEYEKSHGKKVDAYFLVVPDSKYEAETGMPKPELAEFFREKFGAKQPVSAAA